MMNFGGIGMSVENLNIREILGLSALHAAMENTKSASMRPDQRDASAPIRAPEDSEMYKAEKHCCTVCDAKKKCHICGKQTLYACSDCQIDLGATVYVCSSSDCRDAHEKKCPERLREELRAALLSREVKNV